MEGIIRTSGTLSWVPLVIISNFYVKGEFRNSQLLAELSTTQIAKAENADGYPQNEVSAKKGGSIAKNARKQLEEQTGKRVVSSENFLAEGEDGKRKRFK